MSDLSAQLENLVQRYEAAPRPGGRGRVIAFMSVDDDPTREAVARTFSELASVRCARSVWLIDLNLADNPQHTALVASQGEAAPASGAFDLSMGRVAFWRVVDAAGESVPQESSFMSLHQVGSSKLFVSCFLNEGLRQSWRVRLRDAPDYWRAARRAADLVVIDAPARRSSDAGLAIAPRVDAVVLVAGNKGSALGEARALRNEIESRGGLCAGVVLVDARAGADGAAA